MELWLPRLLPEIIGLIGLILVWVLRLLPEIIGLLLVVLWPIMYRSIAARVGRDAATRLSLPGEEARAMANFHQDLGLAATGAVLLSFSYLRLVEVLRTSLGATPPWSPWVGMLYVFVVGAFLVKWHLTADVAEYLQTDTKRKGFGVRWVSPFPGVPPWTKVRVGGRTAREIFLMRIVLSLGSVTMSAIALGQ